MVMAVTVVSSAVTVGNGAETSRSAGVLPSEVHEEVGGEEDEEDEDEEDEEEEGEEDEEGEEGEDCYVDDDEMREAMRRRRRRL